jgi:acyl phosphate:glycerol-3-phosphate acyltransferase
MLLPLTLAALIGYFLGALPFGWLIARRFGINIFEHGSKNPGATNVKRVLGGMFGQKGKRAGDLAFTLDALKGAAAAVAPVWMYAFYFLTQGQGGLSSENTPSPPTMAHEVQVMHIAAITGLVFALVGHSFSCWTRFKGGKGVATSAGGLVVLLPLATLLAALAWVATFLVSRYVSLASIVAAVVLPAAAWLLPGTPIAFAIIASVIGAFVILRHRANIVRLANGTENKFARATPK